MDFDQVRKILELMEANKLVEFEYESEGTRIKLRRSDDRAPASVPVVYPPSIPAPAAVASAPATPVAPAKSDSVVEFKSPLVGTFYRAPRPDADPYVNVGDEVQPDKVLCIVEAMKMMNEIKAEMNGVVREILVKNGQAVEFGEVLFLIEKK